VRVYYNEFDPKKCAMLQALMDDGHISKGDIDGRSIRDVRAEDLDGYTRCHFFAGIGLWDYALNLAGWPEDLPVWTGSCPCQPYSTAGRQKAQADDRHLWPEWLRLIRECHPSTILGEQVANSIGHGWLDDVYQGLEAEGYAIGSAVLPACSVGAPHKRDRLFFVADTKCQRPQGHAGDEQNGYKPGWLCSDQSRPAWQTGVWIDCPDGKQRLVEPGISLLADGYPERVAIIHAAGDGIVPQLAAEFIGAYMDTLKGTQK